MSIVGVDIGGTFTGLVGYRDGAIIASKTSTVPSDPTEGIAAALKLAGCDLAAMAELIHGSTDRQQHRAGAAADEKTG